MRTLAISSLAAAVTVVGLVGLIGYGTCRLAVWVAEAIEIGLEELS